MNLSGPSKRVNVTGMAVQFFYQKKIRHRKIKYLAAEKRLIYRILIFTVVFVLGLFWLTYLAWYNPIVR